MIINYFLILVALLLVSGLALDAGLLEWRYMAVQSAADAAALEAMSELARNNSAWSAAGQAQAANNGFTNNVNGVTVTIVNPPASGTYAGQVTAVQATVSQTVNNVFMSLVNAEKSTVSATAIANILPTCVWIMGSPGSTSTPSLKLSSAGMGGTCGIYVNTVAPGYNLGVDYFSNLNGNRIRAAGSSAYSTSSGNLSPTPRFGAAHKNDPLAYVTAPTFSSCTYYNFAVGYNTYYLNPGTYCGGMTLTTATVFMSPGLYIITGNLSLSGASVFGTGVTIYMTQGGGFGYGSVLFTNSTFFSVSAPTSASGGSIPGLVFFEDRNYINHNNQSIVFTGGTVKTDGIWYALNTGISTSASFRSAGNYLGMVIDNYYSYSGNTNPAGNYAPLNYVSPLHYDDGALVQ